MFPFPAVIIQTGHDTCGNLMNAEQFFSPSHAKTWDMTDSFVLRFLHFQTMTAVGNNDLDCSTLWKLRHIFDLLMHT
jgi:hypothetical protein